MVGNKIELNGKTIIDLSEDDTIESDVRIGKKFHKSNGEPAVGTAESFNGGGGEQPTLYAPSIAFDNYEAMLTINDISNGKHAERYLIYYGDNYVCSTSAKNLDLLSVTSFTGNASLKVIASAEQFNDSPAAVVLWTQPRLPLTVKFVEITSTVLIAEYDNENTAKFDVFVDGTLVTSTLDTIIVLSNYITLSTSTHTVKVVAVPSDPYYLNSTPFQTEWVVRSDGTPGLQYSIDTTNGYAICTGMGSATDKDIIIASIYDGYPVTRIADRAFAVTKGDYELTSVYFPEGVTHIGEYAFEKRYGIETIYIPSSLIYVGKEVFNSPDNLFISDMSAWCKMTWNKLIAGSPPSIWLIDTNLYLNNQLVTELIIPDDVTAIPEDRFRGSTITSVHIPAHVTEIGPSAFGGCDEMITATVPKTVTSIGDYAFGGDSLQDLVLAPSVELLPVVAFSSVKRLALGKSIKRSTARYDEKDFASLTDLYYEGTEEEFAEVIDDLYLPINIYENVTIHYNVNLDNFTFPEIA